MRTKGIIITLAGVLLAAFALGVSGVLSLSGGAKDGTEGDGRLIGVLVTTEYLDLFDAQGYFNDNAEKILSGGEISPADAAAYQGRLYAALRESPDGAGRKKYVFEGVEGIAYFSARYTDAAGAYHGNSGDEALSDGHMSLAYTDEGESLELEGTIYVSTAGGADAFYYNPVYQTERGEIYAVSGSGMSYGGERDAGLSGSHELREEYTATVGGETKSGSTRVEISIRYVDAPMGVALLQLDSASRLLSREEYAPGVLPERVSTLPDTAFILLETRGAGQSVTRALYQPGDESLFAFFCRADGICVKQWCALDWHGAAA